MRPLTGKIESQEHIRVIREEVLDIDPEVPTIVATGPLTSEGFAARLSQLAGSDRLFFYDAISPIVDAQSIDMDRAFFGSRWDRQSADYLNCPRKRGRIRASWTSCSGRRGSAHAFEDARFFDACLPIEVIAGAAANR